MKVVRHLLLAGLAGLAIVLAGVAQEKDKTDPDPKAKAEPKGKENPKVKTDPEPKPKVDPKPKEDPEPKPKAKVDVPATPPEAARVEEVGQGFRAYIVAEPRFKDVRNREGKMQDLVTDHGLNPVIAVFSRIIPADANHALTGVVKKLDELAEAKEYRARRLGVFLVFVALTNEFRKDLNRDARITEVKQFVAGAMPKYTTVGLAEATETPDGTEQPLVPAQLTAMGIGEKDDIVIVLYHKFQVIKRWKFTADAPPTDDDLKAIDAEVVKLLGPRKIVTGEPPAKK